MQKPKNPISEKVTEFIKTRKQFSLESVLSATGFKRRAVLPFLNKLCREGYLMVKEVDFIKSEKKEAGPYNLINPIYFHLKDLSLRAPKRLEKNRGKEVGSKNLRNSKYCRLKDLSLRMPKQPENNKDKVWRTLRYLRKATRSDLVRLTGCRPGEVKNYTQILAIHQYIRAIGKQGRETVWFLVKDTGPIRPIISEKKES